MHIQEEVRCSFVTVIKKKEITQLWKQTENN